jgi:hypothetical protein
MKTHKYVASVEILRGFEYDRGMGFIGMGKFLRDKGIIPRKEILKSVVFEDIPEKKVIIFTLAV